MNPGIITAIVVASSMAYALMFGVTLAILDARDVNHRLDSIDRYMGSLFWPLALPVLGGVTLVQRLQRPKLPRATARDRQ